MSPRAANLLVLSVVLAMVPGCAGDRSGDAPRAPAGATATAAATGVLTSEDPRSTRIAELVASAVSELQLQSVVFAVWVGDQEIVRGAIDAPSVQPPTAIDARVRVGQPMEAMLGTVLLQLGSEGVIDLDAPVAKYVPDLVNGDRITPRMLANSTGGTPDYVTDPAFVMRVSANPFAGYTLEELLGFARRRPPLFDPGKSFAYSHTEMAALVQVLVAASGQSLGELMAARIFRPLGMTASAAHQNNAIEEPAFHAFTHQRGVYEDSTHWDPTWGFHGGMNASVADLGRWLRALDRGELLNEADARESLAPVTAGLAGMTEQRYFAYGSLVSGGWILGNPSLNGYMGFTAQHRDPSVTIVVWSTAGPDNPEDSNASETITKRIASLVSDEPIDLPTSPTSGPEDRGGVPPGYPLDVDVVAPLVLTKLAPDPVPVTGTDGRVHVVYELAVQNVSPRPATLTRIETRVDGPDGAVVAALGQDEILARSLLVANFESTPFTEIPVGRTAVVLLDAVFPTVADVPAALTHRFEARFGPAESGSLDALAARYPDTVSQIGGAVRISDRKPVIVGPPLSGQGWAAGNACCARTSHRGAMIPLGGRLNGAERFAVDWVRFDLRDDRLRTSHGDDSRNEGYLAYDAPVLAVADGTVVSVVSDLPDQPPQRAPTDLGIDELGGNHVILDIGDGNYAFFAHLKPGSATVRAGDRVTRGQVIGRLGNSGNTTEPHLHFHVSRAPLPLSGDNVPYVIDRFRVDGSLGADDRLVAGPGAGERTLQMPLEGDVVGFPSNDATPATVVATGGDFAGRIDIGGGRSMYVECSGSGSPTVVLVSGLRSSAQEWHTTRSTASPPARPVFEDVARTHRVCAYDRPGTVVGEGTSRSDPVPQPTHAAAAADDLHALLATIGERRPVVLVGHSIGGTIVRLYAAAHPDDVAGMVLVDAASEFLQDAETPDQWKIQRRLMKVDGADIADSVAEYPDIERFDIDATFASLRAAPPLRPMPLVVISADELLAPRFPAMIAAGTLPADTPADFGATFDAAQARAQAGLARLVPDAVHITRTESGHDVHLLQPQIVTESIRRVAAQGPRSKQGLESDPAP